MKFEKCRQKGFDFQELFIRHIFVRENKQFCSTDIYFFIFKQFCDPGLSLLGASFKFHIFTVTFKRNKGSNY